MDESDTVVVLLVLGDPTRLWHRHVHALDNSISITTISQAATDSKCAIKIQYNLKGISADCDGENCSDTVRCNACSTQSLLVANAHNGSS